jgi:cyclopropane fatty-acyl-phospholipid synthase-like methyltransferase
LEAARDKNLDWDKVTLQAADAYNLPHFSAQFDACIAVDWFAHVPRSRFHRFLRGVHQKLARNAVVLFCDQLPGPHSLSGRHDAEGNHLQERTLSDGTRYRVIKHFLSDRAYRAILSPYATEIWIDRFTECRRIVVSYVLNGQQEGASADVR